MLDVTRIWDRSINKQIVTSPNAANGRVIYQKQLICTRQPKLKFSPVLENTGVTREYSKQADLEPEPVHHSKIPTCNINCENYDFRYAHDCQ
jgi:hypothetical protein